MTQYSPISQPGAVAQSDGHPSGMWTVAGPISCPATFFHGDWSSNNFYGHSLPSADSRRAVFSYWRKNVH